MKYMWKKISYLVLIAYLVFGFFVWPALGVIALICMLAPVVLAPFRGREWCGLYCPRGSLWDSVLAKAIARREVPKWAKAKGVRIFMLVFIFTVFGIQTYYAWPDLNQIGMVFLRIIFITTLVGIALAFVYSPRTWCNFCPMGTLAAWASTKKKGIQVAESCVNCKLCVKACPMNLKPQEAKGTTFVNQDCLKCQACVNVCPKKALTIQ